MNIERTGVRDLTYSKWRRTCGRTMYCTDLDFIEWRHGRGIVALVETKHLGTMTPFQRKVYIELAKKLNVPAYCVTYMDFVILKVENIITGETKLLTEQEYRDFIQKL